MFTRVVEPGRLALINYGPYAGKTASIVDMVNLQRVVIDGPEENVPRHVIPLKWINLTNHRVKVCRGVTEKFLKKCNAASGVHKKFKESAWGKKIERRNIRKNLTDLERFQSMVAHKEKSKVIKAAVKKSNKKK